MKNDLTCGLVRDLLPSYVEGLVCGETQEAVERIQGNVLVAMAVYIGKTRLIDNFVVEESAL